MVQGCKDDLTGCGRRHGQTMEIPLTDGGGGRRSLDAGADAERPEVEKHKEDGQPPGTGVENKQTLRVRHVTTKEHSGEHGHPDPSPGDNPNQGEKPNHQESRVGVEDLARKFEYADGFAKGMAAVVDEIDPKHCQYARDEGEPAHDFILETRSMPLTPIA